VLSYTLKQLEYFIAVARTGNVTAAAAAIPMSQSALSASMADLERALEVQLLVRHHARGVTLTSAGSQLLAEAQGLLGHAESLHVAAHDLGSSPRGVVRVGCFSVLAPYILPGLYAECARRFPHLVIEARETDLDELEQGVLSGRFEIGIGYGLVEQSRLSTERLARIDAYALLPRGHRLARRKTLPLAELGDEPMILLDLPHSREYFRGVLSRAGVAPNIVYRTGSVETARAMVGQGLGWTILNMRPRTSHTIDGSEVTAVTLSDADVSIDLVLLYLDSGRRTARVEAVAQVLRHTLERATGPFTFLRENRVNESETSVEAIPES
jgi:DNA-binding transcriptional LysR family regulator